MTRIGAEPATTVQVWWARLVLTQWTLSTCLWVLFKNLSRSKPAVSAAASVETVKEKKKKKLPKVEDFFQQRDYVGALTLLEVTACTYIWHICLLRSACCHGNKSQFLRSTGKAPADNDLWIAYASFHGGDYERARTVSTAEVCYIWEIRFF